MPSPLRSRFAVVRASGVALSALLWATAAFAHHGWSDYDADHPLTLKGEVRTSSYENPHATITLDADGKRYTVILAPVSRMESRGAPRESIAVGKPVTVVGYPSKTHPTEVRAERIVVGGGSGDRTVELAMTFARRRRRRIVTRARARARALGFALAVSAGVLAPLAEAHHAWNEIDTAKTFTLTGIVKSLKWENPHASLVLETDEAGAKVEWTVQMSGLARMQGRGVDEATVAVGKVLVIVASPARDEPRVVRANRIRSDGKDHVLY